MAMVKFWQGSVLNYGRVINASTRYGRSQAEVTLVVQCISLPARSAIGIPRLATVAAFRARLKFPGLLHPGILSAPGHVGIASCAHSIEIARKCISSRYPMQPLTMMKFLLEKVFVMPHTTEHPRSADREPRCHPWRNEGTQEIAEGRICAIAGRPIQEGHQ